MSGIVLSKASSTTQLTSGVNVIAREFVRKEDPLNI